MQDTLTTPAPTAEAMAEAMAANFNVAELEPRLENTWPQTGYPDGGIPL